MTSRHVSLDGPNHMTLTNFRGLGNVGTLMAMKGALSSVSESGIMAASTPLSLRGKARKRAHTQHFLHA